MRPVVIRGHPRYIPGYHRPKRKNPYWKCVRRGRLCCRACFIPVFARVVTQYGRRLSALLARSSISGTRRLLRVELTVMVALRTLNRDCYMHSSVSGSIYSRSWADTMVVAIVNLRVFLLILLTVAGGNRGMSISVGRSIDQRKLMVVVLKP